MQHDPLTIEELRDLINTGEAKDPLIFLESIMNGQDPRELSSTFKLICDIDEFSGGQPSKGEWSEIVDHVFQHNRYKEVSLDQSITASKTVAEYLHAKRKQVDIKSGGSKSNAYDNPLNTEEIELFKEKFNDEF